MVRVLKAGPTLEFCGGTHVSALGDIGLVKIVSEGSIGSNLRRIEAVTGSGTIDVLREAQAIVDGAADLLSVPKTDVVDGVDKRLAEIKELRSEIATLKRELAGSKAIELASSAVDGVLRVKRRGEQQWGPNRVEEEPGEGNGPS